jgi:hypothetical protein
MTRSRWGFFLSFCLLVPIAGLSGVACQLRRPDTVAVRMIEPQLVEPPAPAAVAADAVAVRLLDTQARAHIGRRLLRQLPDGELTEDPVWRWTSAPDRYLDTALRLELASARDVRLVDSGTASALAVTLLVWQLESAAGGTRLAGAIELQLAGADRGVNAGVVRDSEPVSADLPGDLAPAAGRLLRRLASEAVTRVRSRAPSR